MNRYKSLIDGEQPEWIYFTWTPQTIEGVVIAWVCFTEGYCLRVFKGNDADSVWDGRITVPPKDHLVMSFTPYYSLDIMKMRLEEWSRQNIYSKEKAKLVIVDE